ncbi:unnamed protein product [Lymnaea stagnalis]|uniref:L-Fucosyltransferase n=1 Tax=Lymnaea stagnalis TaxID=6523 RepID=A0AAV2HKK3_LYMST
MARRLSLQCVVVFSGPALLCVAGLLYGAWSWPSLRERLTPSPTADGTSVTYSLTINHDQGRMGNKLFKYASLLGLARTHGRHAFVNPYKEDLDMAKVFNLTHVEKHSEISRWPLIEEKNYATVDDVFKKLPPTNVRLRGYVQSWRYFDAIKDEIRREFQFLPKHRSMAEEFRGKLLQDVKNGSDTVVVVGVHVRQRDQKSLPNTTVAPASFYRNAFLKMRSLLPGRRLVFVVSSNDLPWCEENLRQPDTVVVQPAPPDQHFAILATSDHMIVSAGSYGWWAGWLTGGHVIYYKRFPLPESFEAKGFVHDDYYPPSWIPVDH